MDEVKRTKGWSLWLPTTDQIELALNGKLFEESGELISILARVQTQGIDEADPDTGKSNRLSLTEEIADVKAQLELIAEFHKLPNDEIEKRKEAKKELKRGWLRDIREHLIAPRRHS